MKKGCVYFHLGWTDIIICMGLLNYYSRLYDNIAVLMRSDAKKLVDFYVRNKPNIEVIYMDTDNGRYYGGFNFNANTEKVTYENNTVNVPESYEILFHGAHDIFRNDQYKGYDSTQPDFFKKPITHFSQLFYTFYDIDYSNRIDFFDVERDILLEEKTYNDFIERIQNKKYVIYHDDQNNHVHGSHHIDTKINFSNINPEYTYFNLNKTTNTFFDYIKILQNAEEIHLIDSIWGCLFYQLDAKYNILNNKTVNLYAMRGHANLFLQPVKLPNWNIIV